MSGFFELNIVAVLVAFGVSCLSTFFRGFQNKTVARGDKKMAFFNGMLMDVCDLVVIASLVHSPTVFVIAGAALGSGLGWVSGMEFHDRVTHRARKAEQKAVKQELKARIDRRVELILGRFFEEEEHAMKEETKMTSIIWRTLPTSCKHKRENYHANIPLHPKLPTIQRTLAKVHEKNDGRFEVTLLHIKPDDWVQEPRWQPTFFQKVVATLDEAKRLVEECWHTEEVTT